MNNTQIFFDIKSKRLGLIMYDRLTQTLCLHGKIMQKVSQIWDKFQILTQSNHFNF